MAVTLEMLSREGTVEVSEREVPGPVGDPDVSLLIPQAPGCGVRSADHPPPMAAA